MGRCVDTDSFLQRSRRKTARRRSARREIRQRLFHLHRLRILPPAPCRRSRSLPPLREHGFVARRKMSLHEHPPFFASWRKAYWFAVVLFAVEVALLYAFTLRFS